MDCVQLFFFPSLSMPQITPRVRDHSLSRLCVTDELEFSRQANKMMTAPETDSSSSWLCFDHSAFRTKRGIESRFNGRAYGVDVAFRGSAMSLLVLKRNEHITAE